MPFRIPNNYTAFTCTDQDKTRPEVEAYIRWLKGELAVAQAALDALILNSPTKSVKE